MTVMLQKIESLSQTASEKNQFVKPLTSSLKPQLKHHLTLRQSTPNLLRTLSFLKKDKD